MGAELSAPRDRRDAVVLRKRNKMFRKEEEQIIRSVTIRERNNKNTSTSSSSGDSCKHDRSMSTWDETDNQTIHIDPFKYQYPFENLVFEGGGNKGLAYCGALQCLEDLGIKHQIKRVGGSSAGAITAALIALGYTANDMYVFLSDKVDKILLDHKCGYMSLIPNVIKRWGWNPGLKIYDWLGEKIKAKTKTRNPDLTFYELYKEKGIELCVVVTNVNQMQTEYCHPKTTPDMSIREALRMSMSIPGVFMVRKYDNNGQKDTYVDGGVLCNYPVHCFDGWYLSMAREDAFLLHMQKLNDVPQEWSPRNAFDSFNVKTIGFLLYDEKEMEVMRYSLERRIGAVKPDEPSKPTKLFREKTALRAIQSQFEREYSRCLKAAESFMTALHKHNLQGQVVISRQQLKKALEDESSFPAEDKAILFGTNISVNDAFEILDKDGNGQITFQELLSFLEVKGIRMHSRIQSYGRVEIKNFKQFIHALHTAWTTNVKNVYIVDADINRTVGINTGHIGASNYVLEDEDREFLFERGYNATVAFLKYFVTINPALVTRKDCVSGSAFCEGVEEEDIAEKLGCITCTFWSDTPNFGISCPENGQFVCPYSSVKSRTTVGCGEQTVTPDSIH